MPSAGERERELVLLKDRLKGFKRLLENREVINNTADRGAKIRISIVETEAEIRKLQLQGCPTLKKAGTLDQCLFILKSGQNLYKKTLVLLNKARPEGRVDTATSKAFACARPLSNTQILGFFEPPS